MITAGQFLPQNNLPFFALIIHQQVGVVIVKGVATAAIDTAHGSVHIQNGIDLVFFAPIHHFVQASEGLFIKPNTRLFIEQGVGIQNQANAIPAVFGHSPNVVFAGMSFFPPVPIGFQVLAAA